MKIAAVLSRREYAAYLQKAEEKRNKNKKNPPYAGIRGANRECYVNQKKTREEMINIHMEKETAHEKALEAQVKIELYSIRTALSM